MVEKQGGARDNLTRMGLRDLSLTFSLVASSGAVSHEVLCICAKDYSISKYAMAFIAQRFERHSEGGVPFIGEVA